MNIIQVLLKESGMGTEISLQDEDGVFCTAVSESKATNQGAQWHDSQKESNESDEAEDTGQSEELVTWRQQ